MLENKTQLITYIGKKEVKKDTVAGTGAIWFGFGDTQEIIHGAAVKLLQHPDVWITKANFDKIYGEEEEQENKKSGSEQGLSSVKNTAPKAPEKSKTTDSEKTGGENESDGEDGAEKSSSGEGGKDSESQGGENQSSDRHSAIVNAILSLDKSNPEHFSEQTGNPIIAAVRGAAGDETIALKEVNAAWKVLSAPKAN